MIIIIKYLHCRVKIRLLLYSHIFSDNSEYDFHMNACLYLHA